MQDIGFRNKMLQSKLKSVQKELIGQLVQSVEGPQSDEGQSCSMVSLSL